MAWLKWVGRQALKCLVFCTVVGIAIPLCVLAAYAYSCAWVFDQLGQIAGAAIEAVCDCGDKLLHLCDKLHEPTSNDPI